MRKKILGVALMAALIMSSIGTFTSCKDYDDDIDALNDRVGKVEGAIKELNDKFGALAYVKSVTFNNGVLTVTDQAGTATTYTIPNDADTNTTYTLDVKQEGNKVTVTLTDSKGNKQDKVITLPETPEIPAAFDPTKLTIDAEGKILYDGKATGVIIPKPEVGISIVEIKEGETVVGLKIVAGEETITFLVSDALPLTSLVFSPTIYVNGIEAINFPTLVYKPWTELLADVSDGTKETSINKGATIASYFVNPSSVGEERIESLKVLLNEATNINTLKAGEAKDPVTATIDAIEDGIMKVKLVKNIEKPFTNTVDAAKKEEKFTTLAIQATSVLTDKEIEAGKPQFVTSDFARIVEVAVTPYIHNAKYTLKTDESKEDAHFWAYTKIHDNAELKGVNTTEGKYIVKEVSYKEKLDLNTLVNVCDQKGSKIATEENGLAFEFKLIDYTLQDLNDQKTNQKEFAIINDKGEISSKKRDDTSDTPEANASAIGREPLIQVVLKNTANNEVVDVRYLKIKWADVLAGKDLGELDNFTGAFDCGFAFRDTVGTPEMNDKVYAVAQEGGISKEIFHSTYKLDNNVYGTLAEAKAGEPASTKLGSIKEIPAKGEQHTVNLDWNLGAITLSDAEYTAGKATRTVYGRYVKNSNANDFFTFSIKYEITIDKMALEAGYHAAYWTGEAKVTNIMKLAQINPALTTDKNFGIDKFQDAQIIGSLLTGYNKTDSDNKPIVLVEAKELVKNAADAEFIFDTDRVKAIVGEGWTVSTDGKELKKGNEIGAVITVNADNTPFISLYENPIPSGQAGKPTAAAQALLGKNVPVKLVSKFCDDKKADIDRFIVNFIKPLKLTLSDVEGSFKDLITDGSTIDVSTIATIVETFGLKRTVWADGKEFVPDPAPLKLWMLVQWYNVEGVVWDLEKAKTNLTIEGQDITIGTEVTSDWSLFSQFYEISAQPAVNPTKLVFENKQGNHLQNSFKIAVPVYVKTKWAPELKDETKLMIELTVEPGDYEKSAGK